MAVQTEKEVDVLVVGAGNAALVAALSAHEKGARVTVLERAPLERRGGNSGFSGGIFRFAFDDFSHIQGFLTETPTAEFKNVDLEPYSRDIFYNDLMRVTDGLADPGLSELLVEESQNAVSWMAAKGVAWELNMNHMSKVGGKLVWRSGSVPVEARGGGKGLVEMLFQSVEKQGIQVIYGVQALELLVDQIGAVTGVIARKAAGKTEIRSRAVILACGGFEASPEMRTRHLGPNWDLAKVRGTRFNTGDGIRMALDLGATPFGHWSGCHASVIADEAPNLEAATMDSNRYSYPYSILVNAEGDRFVDEGEDLQVYTYAKIGRRILGQPGRIAYQIFDQKTIPLLRTNYAQSRPVVARSVEELASALEIEPERLRRTFDQFNQASQGGQFDPTRRDGKATVGLTPPKSNWAVPLDSPPFQAYAVACGITFTYGGISIDRKTQVLTPEEREIPGLFAAGELTGGFFYYNYPSGSGLTRGAVTGRIAGIEAAKYSRGL